MKKFLNEMAAKAVVTKGQIADKANEVMTTPMKGATAMEYVLIVAIMAGFIIVAWNTFLGPAISQRMRQTAGEITQNYGAAGP